MTLRDQYKLLDVESRITHNGIEQHVKVGDVEVEINLSDSRCELYSPKIYGFDSPSIRISNLICNEYGLSLYCSRFSFICRKGDSLKEKINTVARAYNHYNDACNFAARFAVESTR